MAGGPAALFGKLQHMRPTACLVVDDVLMTSSRQRSIGGHAMLTALASVYDVVLLTRDDRDEISDWLYGNGIGTHAALFRIEPVAYSQTVDIVHFANQLRHIYRYPVELFVVGNPNEAALLFEDGYMVTLFMHPAYTRPEWRPTASKRITPWGEIATFMSAEAAMAAADERTKED